MKNSNQWGIRQTPSDTYSSIDEGLGIGVTGDATHPLCLVPGDTSGFLPISFQLSGSDNYALCVYQ